MTETSKISWSQRWSKSASLKGWVSYLMILVIMSLLLIGFRLILPDSMVIYAQKDGADFIQVFFPIGGA